jgi:hypothetical protein
VDSKKIKVREGEQENARGRQRTCCGLHPREDERKKEPSTIIVLLACTTPHFSVLRKDFHFKNAMKSAQSPPSLPSAEDHSLSLHTPHTCQTPQTTTHYQLTIIAYTTHMSNVLIRANFLVSHAHLLMPHVLTRCPRAPPRCSAAGCIRKANFETVFFT